MDICREDERRTLLSSYDDTIGAGPSRSIFYDDATTKRDDQTRGAHHKPNLLELLRTIGLDNDYHRAQGDRIYYFDELGREIEVLDLVSGYGTLLFGHNHPDLTNEAIRFLASASCNHAQGSASSLADSLAAELSRRAEGDFCVTFGNSGAEAVEAAMKHALLETGGQTFMTLDGAFHGKTLGALQLTSSPIFRQPFGVRGVQVERVSVNNVRNLEAAFAHVHRPAGFFFEPIQGEGGIRQVRREFLRRIAELCAEHRIPLIADECQTGLGRTGTYLASHALGVRPDYIIVSKALGGGIAKISAVLIDRLRYRAEFDVLHSSTFANDGFSCAIGLKTLKMLDDETLESCREKGAWLKRRLQALKKKYPAAITNVRGMGLMLGVELRKSALPDSFVLRFLAARDLLGLFVAGYLLNVHQIRVAPTLSDSTTLRIQPSVLIQYESMHRIVAALEDLCVRLQRRDIVGLTAFLLQGDARPGRGAPIWPSRKRTVTFRPSRQPTAAAAFSLRRVAWLFHLNDADDLPSLEPSLQDLDQANRKRFLDSIAPFAMPVAMDRVEIRSGTGDRVQLQPLLLPVTSRWLKFHFERRRFRKLRTLVQQGIDVAFGLGCEFVSLGQFTSIVTRHGRNVSPQGMSITSGNSFSAALAVNAVQSVLAGHGLVSTDCTLAIVGATGDIGRVCAEILAPEFRKLILIGSGRQNSARRLKHIARRIGADWSCDLMAVRAANIVICATNAVDLPLTEVHLANAAIVCDVSMPATLDRSTIRQRSDLSVLRGSVVRLPFNEELGIPGLPLPPGYAYGCLAEGILLALEGFPDMSFVGRSSVCKVNRMESIARRHGFLPADRTTPLPVVRMMQDCNHVSSDLRRFA
jgi:acetylornithine/succinyldiaminopimelate/putrescine aminotransferase/predicted amino acid dehydrogenase